MKKFLTGALIVFGALFYFAGVASADTMTVSPDTVADEGEQEIQVDLSGFSADIALFVLPCAYPEGGNMANFDSSTCDQTNLTPIAMDGSGAGTLMVTLDIAAPGIAIIAGDASQTESAVALVSVVTPPSMSLDIQGLTRPGPRDIEVSLSGFTPETALFVLPCAFPAGGDMAAFDNTTCDQANLSPIAMDADGAGTLTVNYDVSPEGIVIIAGDAAQTESALALLPIVPSAMTVTPGAIGEAGTTDFEVSLSGFSPGIALFVLPCDYPAGGDLAAFDNTTCDQANLTPIALDDNGEGTLTVTLDHPAEGIAIIAGDAAQSQSALGFVGFDEALAPTTTTEAPATTTEAPAAEDTSDDSDDDGGSGGTIVIIVIVIAALAAAGAVIMRRKNSAA